MASALHQVKPKGDSKKPSGPHKLISDVQDSRGKFNSKLYERAKMKPLGR